MFKSTLYNIPIYNTYTTHPLDKYLIKEKKTFSKQKIIKRTLRKYIVY